MILIFFTFKSLNSEFWCFLNRCLIEV